MGAVKTFDYNSPSCGLWIRQYTGNSLGYVLDCITTADTMQMCYEAIGAAGGRYISLDPPPVRIKYSRRDIYADTVLALTLFGEFIRLPGYSSKRGAAGDRQIGARFSLIAQDLLNRGLLKPPALEIKTGGLEALGRGIDDVRKGRVKGRKLVYPLL